MAKNNDWTKGRAEEDEKMYVAVDGVLLNNLIITCLNQIENLLEDADTSIIILSNKEDKAYHADYLDNLQQSLREIAYVESVVEPIILSFIDYAEEDMVGASEEVNEIIDRQSILLLNRRNVENVYASYKHDYQRNITEKSLDNLLDNMGIIRPKNNEEEG